MAKATWNPKIDDRTKSPGKVKSGKVSADAHGAQKPIGSVSLKRK